MDYASRQKRARAIFEQHEGNNGLVIIRCETGDYFELKAFGKNHASEILAEFAHRNGLNIIRQEGIPTFKPIRQVA